MAAFANPQMAFEAQNKNLEDAANASKTIALKVVESIDHIRNAIPVKIRRRITGTLESVSVGVAILVPFLYALANSDGSFLNKDSFE